uniref:Uncharacterized protein n=1 Tax=Heterorhabditis bacteriophora TaxID=37862 RepID=A0A1I7XPI5_HETBA
MATEFGREMFANHSSLFIY